ncbi:high affinity cationic amino acid transporter 1-like [Bolinopsis microptera]|uniref:high affinity cationic amino acid transporter 1-like n=1 Tax=Bolinopsis microptera TaxID=2820187 RepID=UPI003079D73B
MAGCCCENYMESCVENYNCKPPFLLERLVQKSSPELQTQDLKKCLNIFDLTVQGLAHIVGAGIFILTPGVIRMVAGPGLVVSYLLAAAVLIFTVLAYMDLGARYRGIGNAYVYVYSALGEFAAGLVGTFIMTEMALAVAVVAVGFGQNIDKFILGGNAHKIQVEYASTFLPDYLTENVNLLTIGLILFCCIVNCIGVKQVAIVNTLTVVFSFISLAMYCIISFMYGSSKTFTNSTDPETGRGGVFPYGFSGVVTGAAVVIMSFAGFESVVSLSAEAKNSKRDVPLATGLSFGISVLVYLLVSAAISYLVPWYTLNESTGIPGSLQAHGLTIPKYIIAAAILFASGSVALCSLTTLARGLMVLSEDGLIFSCIGLVAESSKVPIIATVFATIVIIFFTIVFSYEILIHLVAGGALVTFVAVCFTLIIISYSKQKEVVDESSGLIQNEVMMNEDQLFTSWDQQDSEDSGYIENQEWKVISWVSIFTVSSTICIAFIYWPSSWPFWKFRFPIMILLGLINTLILIHIKMTYHIQPQKNPGFVCPGIPFIPAIGIFLNLALFSSLNVMAHLMTVAYFAVGVLMYFGYGYFHSTITLKKQKEQELIPSDETEE